MGQATNIKSQYAVFYSNGAMGIGAFAHSHSPRTGFAPRLLAAHGQGCRPAVPWSHYGLPSPQWSHASGYVPRNRSHDEPAFARWWNRPALHYLRPRLMHSPASARGM